MNQDLPAIILAEEVKYGSLGPSHVGGWHSRPDFLRRRRGHRLRAATRIEKLQHAAAAKS